MKVEVHRVPKVCVNCQERKESRARGEYDACCDECDNLAEWSPIDWERMGYLMREQAIRRLERQQEAYRAKYGDK